MARPNQHASVSDKVAVSATGGVRGLCDPAYGNSPQWEPPADTFEYPDAVVVWMDLPGVLHGDVSVDCGPLLLTIRGERHLRPMTESEESRSIERGFGRFARAFHLPCAIDADRITVELRDGVLVVRMPKRGAASPPDARPIETEETMPAAHCEWCGAEYPVPVDEATRPGPGPVADAAAFPQAGPGPTPMGSRHMLTTIGQEGRVDPQMSTGKEGSWRS